MKPSPDSPVRAASKVASSHALQLVPAFVVLDRLPCVDGGSNAFGWFGHAGGP